MVKVSIGLRGSFMLSRKVRPSRSRQVWASDITKGLGEASSFIAFCGDQLNDNVLSRVVADDSFFR